MGAVTAQDLAVVAGAAAAVAKVATNIARAEENLIILFHMTAKSGS